MKEVKKPKKPLIFYYLIAMVIILLLSLDIPRNFLVYNKSERKESLYSNNNSLHSLLTT